MVYEIEQKTEERDWEFDLAVGETWLELEMTYTLGQIYRGISEIEQKPRRTKNVT